MEFQHDFRQFSTLIRQLALLRAEFEPPKLSFHSDVRRRAALHWALTHISSFLFSIAYIQTHVLLHTRSYHIIVHTECWLHLVNRLIGLTVNF